MYNARYAEGKSYDYSKEPPIDTPAGHFTQMVYLNTITVTISQ